MSPIKPWILLAMATLPLVTQTGYTAEPIKIVFLAGTASHGYGAHEHLAGSRIIAETIEQATEGVACEVYGGGWPQDATVLDDADTIVMYCDGGKRHPALKHLDVLGEHMRRGVGFACLHYGVEVPKDEGGAEFLEWLGGYFETHWSVNPHWTADYQSLPSHPVARGVQPFAADDEWYFHMRFREAMQGVTPILSAVPPPETMLRKDGPHSGNPAVRKEVAQKLPQHTAWVFERPEGGRSFGFTGGHHHWNWGRPEMLKLVSNAILWTAGGSVPNSGLDVVRLPLEKLEQGQDEEPNKKYDANEIRVRFELAGGDNR